MSQIVFTAKAKKLGKALALALGTIIVMTVTTLSIYSKGVGLGVAIFAALGLLVASFLLIIIGSIALGALVLSFIKKYKEKKAEQEAIDTIIETMNRHAERRMAEADAKEKRKAAPVKRKTSAKKTETEQPKKKTTRTKKSK